MQTESRIFTEQFKAFVGQADELTKQFSRASLIAQLGKNLPAMLETWVQSRGWKDPMEKGKATRSNILAWRTPWTDYSPWGHKESDMTEQLSLTYLKSEKDKPNKQ